MRVYRLVHTLELVHNHPFKPRPNLANRWNNDYPAAYASDSLALAALEVLGGWGQYDTLDGYRIYTYTLTETDIERALTTNPNLEIQVKSATKRFGDEWAHEQRSLALAVPSVRIPIGDNYLINYQHPLFSDSNVADEGSFAWDHAIVALIDAAKGR